MIRNNTPCNTSRKMNPYLAILEMFGISKSKLSKIAGVSVQTVTSWIKNESEPSYLALQLIKQELGISIDCLMDGYIVLLNDKSNIPWHLPLIPSAIVLREYRIKKGISIREFSDMLGLPADCIVSYETGRDIPLDDAHIIAEKCSIPIELLIGYNDYNKLTPKNRQKAIIALSLQFADDANIVANLLRETLTDTHT